MKISDLSIDNSINTKQPNHPNYVPLTVECYSEINQAVLKAGDTRFYDCFLVLREVYKFRGNCSKKEAALLLSQQLNITKWSAYKLIRDGDGLFWNNACKTKDKVSTVWLVSIEKVCIHYGIKKVYQSVIIDLKHRWSIQSRRAGIYEGAIVKQPKSRAIPVSREKITERTGVSKTTQLRYEKRWKAQKEYNWMVVCELDKLSEEQQQFRVLEHTADIHGEYRVETVHGRKVLLKQIPNTYYDKDFEFGEKSVLIRLNKQLSNAGDKMAPETTQLHPYKNSKKQILFRNINIWIGKITLNFKIDDLNYA